MKKEKFYKPFDIKEFMTIYGYKGLICLTFSLIFLIIYVSIKNFTFISFIDALTYVVFIDVFVGGLSWITNLGFFDIFAYNFLRFKNYINKYRDENISRMNGTYDYTKTREFQRKNNKLVPLTYLFIALLFLIPLIILYIIYRANIY